MRDSAARSHAHRCYRSRLGGELFHERIEGSVLRVHRGVGHFPMEEAPEATVADVREFMRRVR